MTQRPPSADHVFVCYARKDEEFVLKLARNLKERGAPVWIDQWDISVSANWEQAVEDALYDCAQFLIVLSPVAVASGEVRGELRVALDEGKLIVPVLYQDCRVPPRLRVLQHADFTGRDPDDDVALAQVLRALGVQEASDLESESPPPEPVDVSPPAKAGVEPSPSSPRRADTPRIVVSPPEKSGMTPDRQPLEPDMVLIPAGDFLMGSDPKNDKDAFDWEQPQHTLYLPDYYLAKTPVTIAQYAVFVQVTGRKPPGVWKWRGMLSKTPPQGKMYHPVASVSWQDAMAYCRWLAGTAGRPYRLPSEAEWEKGARGTDGRIYPWGNKWGPKLCNSEEAGPGVTTPVGAYPDGASPYGLLDMAGNVWEWTCSIVKDYPYDPEDGREDVKAEGPRVVRGGAYFRNQRYARCACRDRDYPSRSSWNFGFRVCVAA